jgi:hypothetical protein
LITVINRGVNGETAQEMLARFDRDVFAANPDLVLWQAGDLRRTLCASGASQGALVSSCHSLKLKLAAHSASKTARFASATSAYKSAGHLKVREKSFCPRRFYQTVVSTKEPIPIPRLTQIVR